MAASLRGPAAHAYDALIAAVALAHDLPLYSANPSDFTGIARLQVRPVLPADSQR